MCCSSFQIPPYNYLSFAIVSFHPVDAFFSRWFIFLRRVGRLLPLQSLRLGLTDSEANAFSEARSPARLGVAFVAPRRSAQRTRLPSQPKLRRPAPRFCSRLGLRSSAAAARGGEVAGSARSRVPGAGPKLGPSLRDVRGEAAPPRAGMGRCSRRCQGRPVPPPGAPPAPTRLQYGRLLGA